MKKPISVLLVLLSMLSVYSCDSDNSSGKSGDSQREKIDSFEISYEVIGLTPSKEFAKDKMILNIVDSLAKVLQNCPASHGCGLDDSFCAPNCEQHIYDCHKISKGLFDTLTNNGNDGHATFPRYQIDNLLNGAQCNVDWIRCYINERPLLADLFLMGRLNHHNPAGLPYETFYSIPLLKKINSQGLVSLSLYRGILTSTGDRITPFSVLYDNGTIEYFDVSNDLP